MKILFDINLWVDMAARPTQYPQAAKLYEALSKEGHTVCLPLCGYTTLFYLVERLLSTEAAEDYLYSLRQRGVTFLSFTSREVEAATKLKMKDHEDACIVATAMTQKIDRIVTRNEKDFKNSPIQSSSPTALLKEI